MTVRLDNTQHTHVTCPSCAFSKDAQMWGVMSGCQVENMDTRNEEASADCSLLTGAVVGSRQTGQYTALETHRCSLAVHDQEAAFGCETNDL